MDTKAIVTNRKALSAKYGSNGLQQIDRALAALIKADAQRGLETTAYDLSNKTEMKSFDGKAVTNPDAPKANKEAIDAICAAEAPAYVLILGGPEIVPHQNLRNPVTEDDPDDDVPSDLPYACDAPYSRDVLKFIGPTRVVGRLPDLAGASAPAYLTSLLKVAKGYKRTTARRYKSYMGVSAKAWRDSSRRSARKLFGTSKHMELSPPNDEKWPARSLKRRSHFINCHGDMFDPNFYGDDEKTGDQPVALTSRNYEGKLTTGTVAAAECCYGAMLYDPHPDLDMAICNRLLGEGAYGFVGSTNIAYGPAEGNGAADYLCQFFFDAVLDGASTGRALLEARHRFVRTASPMHPVDHKTLGQFILLGDPSVHPVRPPKTSKSKSALKKSRPAERGHRRKLLRDAGKNINRSTAKPATQSKGMSKAMRTAMMQATDAKESDLVSIKTMTMKMQQVTGIAAKNRPKRGRKATSYMIVAKKKPSQSKKTTSPAAKSGRKGKRQKAVRDFLERGIVIVAKEVDGSLERIQELLPH